MSSFQITPNIQKVLYGVYPDHIYHPQFVTSDIGLTLIDECFEAQRVYYESLGTEAPDPLLYASGEVMQAHDKIFWLTGMENPKKRTRGFYEDQENPWEHALDKNGEPEHKRAKATCDPGSMVDVIGGAGDDDISSVSSSSLMTDSPSALDLNSLNSIERVSSDTSSAAADIDDDTSEYSSSDSSSSGETAELVGLACAGKLGSDIYDFKEDGTEEITNVVPQNQKPNFALAQLKDSPIVSRIPEFLAAMEAANKQLEAEMAAGNISDRRIEITEADGEPKDGQYIEMNLGLGVLEEKNNDDTESSDMDTMDDSGENIMEMLMGGGKVKGEEGTQDKKFKIEEL